MNRLDPRTADSSFSASQIVATSAWPAATPRWKSHAAMFAAGGVSIIAGGLVAAVTGPTGWTHGSWVAAFLVLVVGVAQIGIAAGQAQLAHPEPAARFTGLECGLWNVGCMTVIAGTLLSNPLTVSIGSALLFAVLGMSIFMVRGLGGQPRMLLWLYRALLVVLLMSTPIGIALSWSRH